MHQLTSSRRPRGTILRKTTAIAVGVIMVAALAACTGSKPSSGGASAAAATTLKMGATIAPQSLSPILNQGNPESLMVMQLAYDSLIEVSPSGKLQPSLATSWKWVDTENKVFQVTIRDGVTFSDGTPLTAEAVANSLIAFRDGKGPNAIQARAWSSIQASGKTVTITSDVSDPGIPQKLGQTWGVGLIISPAGLANQTALASATAGTGPYVLDASASQIGSKYVYKKNPHYWNSSHKRSYSTITYSVISDQNALLSAMQTGEIDYFPADPVTASTAVSSAHATSYTSPYTLAGIRVLDRAGQIVPALADVRVRQAFQYAIDRSSIAKALGYGYAKPFTQFMPKGLEGYFSDFDNYYKYNPTKAKQLLTEAGYPNGIDLKLTQAQQAGGQVAFTSAMIAQLAKVGINVTQVVAPSSQHSANVNSKTFPLSGGSFGGGYEPQMFYTFTIGKGAFSNPFGVTDPEMDADFAAAAALPQGSARLAEEKKGIKRLLDLSWFIPVLLIPQAEFVSSANVKGANGGVYAYPDPAFFSPKG
jgi:peptide/nickel transport system substrate-binding protein